MADDIVTRLRNTDYEYEDAELAFAAADAIERLRSALDAEGNEANLLMLEIKRLRAAEEARIVNLRLLNETNADLSRLRAAGDALLRAVEQLPINRFDQGLAVINAMHDWEEARRG